MLACRNGNEWDKIPALHAAFERTRQEFYAPATLIAVQAEARTGHPSRALSLIKKCRSLGGMPEAFHYEEIMKVCGVWCASRIKTRRVLSCSTRVRPSVPA